MSSWQDNPKHDEFEGYVADLAPHLSGASWNDAQLQALRRQFQGGGNSSARSAGALRAAKTRAKNAEKNIDQKYLLGSAKQKQWAAEIRGQAFARVGDEMREFFDERTTHSTFWIEHRHDMWSVVFEECRARWAEFKAAAQAHGDLRQAGASADELAVAERRVLDAIDANNRGLGLS